MTSKKLIVITAITALILVLGLFFLAALIWDSNVISFDKVGARTEKAFEVGRVTANKLEPEPPEIIIVAVGDIMLSRVVEQKMLEHKNFNYPFLKTADYLKSADLAFGNLETAIMAGRIIKTGEIVFRSDPKATEVLKDNNFQIVSLANNHTPNFGEKGLKDTFEYLNKADILYVGAGENLAQARTPKYTKINDIKIAWLARTEQLYAPDNYAAGAKSAGTAFWNKEEILSAVAEAKKQADVVFVSMHAGTEYADEPTEDQMAFARAAIKAGAEIVIGPHPHVVQMAEKYQGKYIFYSLGNFIFDQMWSKETREGLALKITLTKTGIKQIVATPILIEDFCQPRILNDGEGEGIVERLGLETDKGAEGYIIK